jgi:adenine phosphoribosyltransferase
LPYFNLPGLIHDEFSYFAAMPIETLLKSLVRDVMDFPRPGIVFKDITPLLAHPGARRQVVEIISTYYKGAGVDAVAAVEARGFIFGTMIAQELNLPFIPIRKSGKLPYNKVHEEYSLEYGTASIEMHTDAVKKGWRILLHDDLLATGGTSAAAASMIQKVGGTVAGFSFIINLAFLPGERMLAERFGLQPHYLLKFT